MYNEIRSQVASQYAQARIIYLFMRRTAMFTWPHDTSKPGSGFHTLQ
ncbi:hypothetical protein [Thermosporothrix hazakensis]|nr:hypothetical protein [Thermosporothrix hazakensis]